MLDETKEQRDNLEEKTTINDTVEDTSTVEVSEKTDVSEKAEVSEKTEVKTEVKAVIDYSKLSLEELISQLKALIDADAIHTIKNEVNAIKEAFNTKFAEFLAEKKKVFIDEGGKEDEFYYKSDEKYTFNGLVKDYQKKVKQYYKQLEAQREDNFVKKNEIIEKIKDLVTNAESATLYNEFKELREQFFSLGAVPREKNEDTWQRFRFHEQHVYDLLHLKSDLRDLDFKHNLEEKTKLVERAEVLAKEDDVNKAFKELQILHRLWKEEIGPVGREFRDQIWDRFKAATEEIHDKRHALMAELEAQWEENIPKKEAVVKKIEELVAENITSHNAWQSRIKEIQALRDEYFAIGKLPKEKSEELWQQLKEVTKTFNKKKNDFYKGLKEAHQENLDKKQALIDKANELKDSLDFDNVTDVFKQIQAEWKTIGHVPRKYSDKMWKEFRGACNHFFDKLHAEKDEANKELIAVFEEKKNYLKNLKESITEEGDVVINDVKKYIQEWKGFGNVPSNMRFIDSKFNKLIDKLFSKLDIDKRDSTMMRFKNTIDGYVEANDSRRIEKEAFFIRKKMDELTRDIKLLENNLGFFSNASPDNPMVKNVYKNIAKHQEDLDLWKEKLNYLKSIL